MLCKSKNPKEAVQSRPRSASAGRAGCDISISKVPQRNRTRSREAQRARTAAWSVGAGGSEEGEMQSKQSRASSSPPSIASSLSSFLRLRSSPNAQQPRRHRCRKSSADVPIALRRRRFREAEGEEQQVKRGLLDPSSTSLPARRKTIGDDFAAINFKKVVVTHRTRGSSQCPRPWARRCRRAGPVGSGCFDGS